ncbi:hypothetical protein [Cytobacillus horneckiae]|uniref:hypothetical protein n=1 Tax=Cytobacillus horneckiae TaxID=549687 RepID=UPI003D25687B
MERIEGELSAYCYQVTRGKPVACMAVQERYVQKCIVIVSRENLFHMVAPLSDGWVTFWVYKYPHMLEIIKNIPDKPKTVTDHWVLGKLFGYDEQSISDFLIKEGRKR